jgi:hypothetical protein
MKHFVTLGLIAAIPLAAPARADIGLPRRAHVDSCIITCPAADSVLTVSVRDYWGYPVSNADALISFSQCPGVSLPPPPPGIPYIVDAIARTVLRVTNNYGRADFPLASGGVCSGGPVKIWVSGQLIKTWSAVASFDQNGDLAVDAVDLALIEAKLGTADQTADFNCDSVVTDADVAIATGHLGHHYGTFAGVGDGPEVGFGVQPAPNPSRGAVDFALRAPAAGHAVLAIHDVSGRRLVTVLDRPVEPGVHHAAWSGRDEAGRPVAAGLYFYRLTLGTRRSQGPLVIAR